MTELLPCPFCRGDAEMRHVSQLWEPKDNYWAACKCCHMSGKTYRTEAEAIAAWNTRAERTCKREKHGTKMDGSPKLRCSLCGYGIGDKRWSYCPNCGAKVTPKYSETTPKVVSE